ncbi:MAG: pyruvate kinase [Polyangiaceae bacterium]|nr:pyruvate kinase [Polyangiaceae bacterium]MBK8941711.1 pyruvate kinase [Polyangiaceae bacterium]
MRFRRAKIVCTIGPSCDSEEKLAGLMKAGMDVARLNFSHGSHEEHGARLDRIRAASKVSDKPVAVLQDLCGPKIRAGRFNRPKPEFLTGSTAFLVESGVEPPEDPQEIPVQYEGLASDLQPGDRVLVDDGQNILSVLGIEGERVKVSVVAGGILRDRVGISLPSRRVRLSTLTEKDKADLAFGLRAGVDYVALSFVREADDIRLLREICEAWGRPTPIVAKIETPSAIEHLDAIIQATDVVMVARGDLGVEIGPEYVPILQRKILGIARKHQKPVIVATEMLQSMVTASRPTRAEASDVATAVFEGTDAVMLSGETATGQHPELVVRMMSRIVHEAEMSDFYNPIPSETPGQRANVAESIARNAADIARDIGARFIVAFTEGGDTARYVSKHRSLVPVVAFSPNEITRRRLALLWGVVPYKLELMRDADEMVQKASASLLANGLVSPGDKVVAIFGAPLGVAGTTNTIRVVVIE